MWFDPLNNLKQSISRMEQEQARMHRGLVSMEQQLKNENEKLFQIADKLVHLDTSFAMEKKVIANLDANVVRLRYPDATASLHMVLQASPKPFLA